jgi:hypothetical protein
LENPYQPKKEKEKEIAEEANPEDRDDESSNS